MPTITLRMRLVAAIAAAVVAAVVVLLLQQPHSGHAPEAYEKPLRAIRLNTAAPKVSFLDRQGKPTPLASYQGRIVFVNYRATWCGPCVAEMPSLIALSRELDPRDIAFVSIAEDDTREPLEEYLRTNPLPFDVFRDRPPRVENLFEVKSYPTSFVIDRDGRALYRFEGERDWNGPASKALFEQLGVRTLRR